MLIAMAVWDTEENGRTSLTQETLDSLRRTVDWLRHRLIIVDNGSCWKTLDICRNWGGTVIRNGENVGTAKAVNQAWLYRSTGEHAVKIDNDVRIHQPGWADVMEEAFSRDPSLGILGLKRKDLEEAPWQEGEFHSTLRMLPHERGQRWIIVEDVEHVIGTCVGFSSALLDKIGYLVQPGLYGFDDSLASARAKVAGFKCGFLCGVDIDHLDLGGDQYCQWKIDQANEHFHAYRVLKAEYEMGVRKVWENA
jgi:GT2 family glycosyltransferase